MVNKKSQAGVIAFVILVFLVLCIVTLMYLVVTPSQEDIKLCKEICQRKGYDYVETTNEWHRQCVCLDEKGNIEYFPND